MSRLFKEQLDKPKLALPRSHPRPRVAGAGELVHELARGVEQDRRRRVDVQHLVNLSSFCCFGGDGGGMNGKDKRKKNHQTTEDTIPPVNHTPCKKTAVQTCGLLIALKDGNSLHERRLEGDPCSFDM